ncbi:glutathionylspermidine synthase family protein [Helicobacter labetoulli]|uniref:glutathionylspermidine synthase family protein n=1 Tax=Helicobacter labetoulli TaxID=2315333 RepID=UPI000EF6D771|nr:glutathionylspermidine synthase family protein [Helicobacter labetoulli]
MTITTLSLPNTQQLESMGLAWHTDLDNTSYISDELIHITEQEANAFYEAGNTLYDMFVEAGEYVIENDLFFELDIPPSLINAIKQSWEEDIHWHLYGRFDLAGGIEGKPIKLLEFNADTPTMLYESALLQWALLKYNNLDENKQFNNIHNALSENFKRLITLGEDTSAFGSLYEGWKILFSCIADSSEDVSTTRFLEYIARESGFICDFAPIDKISFCANEGVSFEGVNYEFLFKLIPWENIAIDEPELALLMSEMMQNHNTIFLNPAYTLLFQSKRMLKILWDLFPHHPLLLPASFEPLANTKQVCKKAFGREGANIEILDSQGRIVESKDGIYANHKSVYQAFYELNSHKDSYYQPNVFFAYESCGLGFRKGGNIIDNFSKFVSHCIK